LQLYREGLSSVQPEIVLPQLVHWQGGRLTVDGRDYDLRRGRLFVVGGGKAAAETAVAFEKIVGADNIAAGLIVAKDGIETPTATEIELGGHPVPNDRGIRATKRMLSLVSDLRPSDTVVCLISGGGSSLMTCPVAGISLEEMRDLNRRLLMSGVPSDELTVVRKHLSRASGGQLARHLQPARVIGLILSDTLYSDWNDTASGPTLPNRSSFSDAYAILAKYDLLTRISPRIRSYIEKGVAGATPELPGLGDPLFDRVQNVIVAENKTAVNAMISRAADLGYVPRGLPAPLTGDVHEVARQLKRQWDPSAGPQCLLAGGEPTVEVRGKGRGGRCQELAAHMIDHVGRFSEAVFLAAGTDGNDFLRQVAGATIDQDTAVLARDIGLDVRRLLADNDSYAIHKSLGTLIPGEQTGTNVGDLFICMSLPRSVGSQGRGYPLPWTR
jgi:glycerate-2-kinase